MTKGSGGSALLLLALAACTPAAPDGAATSARGSGSGEEAASARAVGSSVATIPSEPTREDAGVAAIAAGDPTANPARAAPSTDPPVPPSFRCAGATPAWTLELADAGAALTIDGTAALLPGELKRTATGAWTWLGATDAAPDRSVALLLVPGQCFPSEGAPAQPYLAELSLADGRRATGCCAPLGGD